MESIASEVGKNFRSLVKIFRFYVVLRRFGYIDPLIYSLDPKYIKDVITQALRDYTSYLASASKRTVALKYKEEQIEDSIDCLVIAKKGDIPQTFKVAYPDVVHEIVDGSDKGMLCISPIVWSKNKKPYIVTPRRVESFLDKVEKDVNYAKTLVSLAIGG
ncbi:hypothetical protein STK_00280 [Sulfurisphaera tokodaii str. 7]|uniref:Uncharacterized protein n=1 Tax=Sulfurisphaera tokodaii (strain DSM 16993 / JCM 10545 / NBRC 100140 / 7) TaxID=273063 RepID=Q977B5_SULTO|nr:hypothetical protein [Sulfurisphaera tokodaii]BAB64979.1 hypothetical protein STK_00280 [Sulfurisphaera tokodaii str. 7]